MGGVIRRATHCRVPRARLGRAIEGGPQEAPAASPLPETDPLQELAVFMLGALVGRGVSVGDAEHALRRVLKELTLDPEASIAHLDDRDDGGRHLVAAALEAHLLALRAEAQRRRRMR